MDKYVSCSFSSSLFVNDSPMEFYLPLHKNKSVMRSLIERGGGKLVLNGHNPNVIRLLYPELTAQSNGMVALEFILDSIERNSLQNIDDYIVPMKRSYCSVVDRTKIKLPNEFPLQSKSKYSHCDDVSILNYMLEEKRFVKAGGNTIWLRAQELKVTDHTWQSMKDRFRRYILPNLNNYPSVDRTSRKQLAKFFNLKMPSNNVKQMNKIELIFSGDSKAKNPPSCIEKSISNVNSNNVDVINGSKSVCDNLCSGRSPLREYYDYEGNPPCCSKQLVP